MLVARRPMPVARAPMNDDRHCVRLPRAAAWSSQVQLPLHSPAIAAFPRGDQHHPVIQPHAMNDQDHAMVEQLRLHPPTRQHAMIDQHHAMIE